MTATGDPREQRFLDGRVVVAWAGTAVAEPLVRALVSRTTGRDPGPLHHTCPACGSVEHGRPYVDAQVWVSVAHVTGLTVVAVSVAGPVGVDVEREAPAAWVRHEAAAKATGTGLVGEIASAAWSADLKVPGHVGAVALLSPPDRAAPAAPPGTAMPRTAPRGRGR
jgi:hypothetical protein